MFVYTDNFFHAIQLILVFWNNDPDSDLGELVYSLNQPDIDFSTL